MLLITYMKDLIQVVRLSLFPFNKVRYVSTLTWFRDPVFWMHLESEAPNFIAFYIVSKDN